MFTFGSDKDQRKIIFAFALVKRNSYFDFIYQKPITSSRTKTDMYHYHPNYTSKEVVKDCTFRQEFCHYLSYIFCLFSFATLSTCIKWSSSFHDHNIFGTNNIFHSVKTHAANIKVTYCNIKVMHPMRRSTALKKLTTYWY